MGVAEAGIELGVGVNEGRMVNGVGPNPDEHACTTKRAIRAKTDVNRFGFLSELCILHPACEPIKILTEDRPTIK